MTQTFSTSAAPATWGAFREAQPLRAYEDVVKQVEGAILRGELGPGDRLPSEREMMAIFRVSRATVREALRVLERMGLVSVRPGLGGTVVSEFSLSFVEGPLERMLQLNQVTPGEMVEFRLAMETTAARWAAIRAEDGDIERMRVALHDSEASFGNWARYHAADVEFHSALADASKNSINRIVMRVLRGVLYGEISSAFGRLSPERRSSEYAHMMADHRAIFDAVERRDQDEAARVMRDHLQTRFAGMILGEVAPDPA